MSAPQHIILIAINPNTEADRQKLAHALQVLMAEDPTFGINSGVQPGQTIVRGVNELQLDLIVDRLKREFGVHMAVGNPQVAYKETLTRMAEGEGRYIRRIGERDHYAHAKIRVIPGDVDSGYVFEGEALASVLPKVFVQSVDQGVREELIRGVLAGYPIDDVKVELYDASFHETDSSELAFKMAGGTAFRNAAKEAKPVLLEPIMATEVVVPEEYSGDIIRDLNLRHGRIDSMEVRGTTCFIKSRVPLSKLLGYATELRSRTEGRGTHSMYFYQYEAVPGGPESNDGDRIAPVVVPRTPKPKGKDPGTALWEPGIE